MFCLLGKCTLRPPKCTPRTPTQAYYPRIISLGMLGKNIIPDEKNLFLWEDLPNPGGRGVTPGAARVGIAPKNFLREIPKPQNSGLLTTFDYPSV